ncbi:MAG: alpha/beta family hydrolase [Polyangiales bacterium]
MIEFRIDAPRKPRAVLLLAHGAGAGMDTPFMEELAAGLAREAIKVLRFEFAYMAARRTGTRKPPERMPVLEERFVEAAKAARARLPLFVGGKSMGGRVATRVADRIGASGVLAYGYPFHPPKKPTQLRVEHLVTMSTPCLVLQGTRDPFGTPDEVLTYALPSTLQVHWLGDGDHSLLPRKQSGRTHAQNMREAIEVSANFVTAQLSGRTR